MSDWIPFQQVDFSRSLQYHVDTRDFHCLVLDEEPKKEDAPLIKSTTDYFTADEVMEFITRLFNESNGQAEWRFLSLIGMGEWLKYQNN